MSKKNKLLKKFDLESPAFSSVVFENLLNSPTKRLIFSDGSQLLESQSQLTSHYTFFDYYNDHYIDTLINEVTGPHLIVTACGSFSHLEYIKYDLKTIKYLNFTGISIFLYETIFIDTGTKRSSLNSISVELKNQHSVIKNSLIGFETTKETLSRLYCFEFEKINEFVQKNNLKNVTVYTGDYNVSVYFKNLYPTIKLKTLDVFLISLFKKSKENFTSFEYIENSRPCNLAIEYKFWCGNRRYDGHRHLTAAYLINKSSLISYQHKIEDSPFSIFDKNPTRETPLWGNIDQYLWFDLEPWNTTNFKIYQTIHRGFDTIKTQGTISMDCDISQKPALEALPVPVSYYQKCFCAIVTEARYAYPMGQFSEKTLNAIKAFSPFILIAPPKTLEYLRLYGIQTFNDVWDESYDLEENHEKRLIKIFKVIDQLDQYSLDQLSDIRKKLLPRLQHNHDVIKNIAKIDINKYFHG